LYFDCILELCALDLRKGFLSLQNAKLKDSSHQHQSSSKYKGFGGGSSQEV